MFLRRYTSADQVVWDQFIRDSKNGTFLFERGYMDYHSDRFSDHSLLCYGDKGKLLAVLPANEVLTPRPVLYSHQGLTYGGFILHRHTHTAEVMQLFDATLLYLHEQGFCEWHYKVMPTLYHRLPAEEDRYALWRNGAQVEACNISCTLDLRADSDMMVNADASRRHRYRLAQQEGMRLLKGGRDLPADEALRRFWPIMEQNMQARYGATPVHTLDEMLLLQRRFPRQIRCYLVVTADGQTLAGEVLYVSQQVAHAQYGHCSPEGRQRGALDFLYLSLIQHFTDHEIQIRYFDFGTSNEQQGRILNESLIAQKEGFGGRGVACPTYVLQIPQCL